MWEINSYKVNALGKGIEEIDWKELNLKDDPFHIQSFPVSSLPNTPSGRLQSIQEFAQAGLIPASRILRLMQFPDLDQVTSLETAQEEHIYKVLDRIIDGDGSDTTFESPEAFDNLGPLSADLS